MRCRVAIDGKAPTWAPEMSTRTIASPSPEAVVFCWGDEFAPKGKLTANTWQGELPWKNFKTGGHP
jgi:hypothetical protein